MSWTQWERENERGKLDIPDHRHNCDQGQGSYCQATPSMVDGNLSKQEPKWTFLHLIFVRYLWRIAKKVTNNDIYLWYRLNLDLPKGPYVGGWVTEVMPMGGDWAFRRWGLAGSLVARGCPRLILWNLGPFLFNLFPDMRGGASQVPPPAHTSGFHRTVLTTLKRTRLSDHRPATSRILSQNKPSVLTVLSIFSAYLTHFVTETGSD